MFLQKQSYSESPCILMILLLLLLLIIICICHIFVVRRLEPLLNDLCHFFQQKNDKDHLEETFIAAVMNEPAGKMDSVDHFAMRLADGLRKLPYIERAKLEIEFLSRILEVQERLGNV